MATHFIPTGIAFPRRPGAAPTTEDDETSTYKLHRRFDRMGRLVGDSGMYWHNGRWQPFTAEWRPNEGLPGWVFSHQWPYMTNDYPADTMADARLTAVFPIHNAICIPILGADNEVLGFVELHNKQDGRDTFTWSDVTFMTSLANTTAVALQNTRLLNQLETQRAQLQALSAQQMTLLEEERQRIARELHDEAGQALIGIKLGLQLLAHKVPPEIPGLLEEVDRKKGNPGFNFIFSK